MIPLAIESLLNFNKIKKTARFKIAPSLSTFPNIPDCKMSSKSVKRFCFAKRYKNKNAPTKATINPIRKPYNKSIIFINPRYLIAEWRGVRSNQTEQEQ